MGKREALLNSRQEVGWLPTLEVQLNTSLSQGTWKPSGFPLFEATWSTPPLPMPASSQSAVWRGPEGAKLTVQLRVDAMRPHPFLVGPLNPGTFSHPLVTHTPTQQHNRTTQNFKAPPNSHPGALNTGCELWFTDPTPPTVGPGSAVTSAPPGRSDAGG